MLFYPFARIFFKIHQPKENAIELMHNLVSNYNGEQPAFYGKITSNYSKLRPMNIKQYPINCVNLRWLGISSEQYLELELKGFQSRRLFILGIIIWLLAITVVLYLGFVKNAFIAHPWLIVGIAVLLFTLAILVVKSLLRFSKTKEIIQSIFLKKLDCTIVFKKDIPIIFWRAK